MGLLFASPLILSFAWFYCFAFLALQPSLRIRKSGTVDNARSAIRTQEPRLVFFFYGSGLRFQVVQ